MQSLKSLLPGVNPRDRVGQLLEARRENSNADLPMITAVWVGGDVSHKLDSMFRTRAHRAGNQRVCNWWNGPRRRAPGVMECATMIVS